METKCLIDEIFENLENLTNNYENIVIHSDIMFLLKNNDIDIIKKKFFTFFNKIIERNKTILIPSFNWDFCSKKKYNYIFNKSQVGTLSLLCESNNIFTKTNDPVYSFLVAGNNKNYFLNKDYTSGFGKNSIFEIINSTNSLVIMINTQNFTMCHYYEQLVEVPFRFLKKFIGDVEFVNKTINNFKYELYVKYLELNVNNNQDRSLSFLNKYINTGSITRKNYCEDFFIDFIDINKFAPELIFDLKKNKFLVLINKDEVIFQLKYNLKFLFLISLNKYIDSSYSIDNIKNNYLKEIGLDSLSILQLHSDLNKKNIIIDLDYFLNNKICEIIDKLEFKQEKEILLEKTSKNDCVSNFNIESFFIDNINNFLTKKINILENKNYKLYDLGLDSLSILQFHNVLLKNNLNCTIEDFQTKNLEELLLLLKLNFDKNKKHNTNKHGYENILDNNFPESQNINREIVSKNIMKITDCKKDKEPNTEKNLDNICFIGFGSALPKKEYTNEVLEDILELDKNWIYPRTGIKSRYYIETNEEFIKMMVDSSYEAINNSNIDKNKIGLVIIASSTPNNLFGDSSYISSLLEINNAITMNLTVACNGFITALITASNFIKNKESMYALIICADCLSRWVDMKNPKTAILFGDGVGSVLIGYSNDQNGILDYSIQHRGDLYNYLKIDVKEKKYEINNNIFFKNDYSYISMDGSKVFNFVTENIPIMINNLLKKNNINIDDIKFFILHQANKRIIDDVSKKMGIHENKFLSNIEKVGNTSAASIPILLKEISKENKINNGDLIIFSGFGAGINYGTILFKWNYSCKKKIALITGGTSGIGFSIANKLSELNYHIIIASRNLPPNIHIKEPIEFFKLDITNVDNLKDLKKYVEHKFGRLDLLINNAGYEGLLCKLIDTSYEDIFKTINVNILGTIYTTNTFIDLLKKSCGIIINNSSIRAAASLSNCYLDTLYSLTKSSIGTFTRGISQELKNICKVYSINPAFVDTPMVERISLKKNINKNYLNNNIICNNNLTKLIDPDDIAEFVGLLVNEKTIYESGDEILILSDKQTSNMQYLYNEINNREKEHKIRLDKNQIWCFGNKNLNVCLFQGQGIENFNYNFTNEKSNYIFKNLNISEKIKKITGHELDFFKEKSQLEINNTYYQQILIFVYSFIGFKLLEYENNIFYKNIDVMIGNSLGEITSLVCSNKITFEDGLKIVNLRGIEMQKTISMIKNTTLLRIIGLDENEIELFLNENIYISNYLYKNIFIIGGEKIYLENFKNNIIENLKEKNISFKFLNVEGAFHTNIFKNVGDNLKNLLETIEFQNSNIKVYSNFEGKVYEKNNFKNLISKQVFNKVDFYKIIDTLNNTKINNICEICVGKKSLINLFTYNKLQDYFCFTINT